MDQLTAVSLTNAEIADMLEEIARLLAFDDANPFRVRAYRRAARTLRQSSKQMSELINQGKDLVEIPTIGVDIAALIEEAVSSGRMRSLEDLRQSAPAIAHDLLEVEGIGPKKARALWQALGISNLEQLHRAVIDQRVREVPGFGPASERRLAHALERTRYNSTIRTPLWAARPVAEALMSWMQNAPGISKVKMAGSYRRARETVGDLDIIAAAPNHRAIIEHLLNWNQVSETISAGEHRATVVLRQGIQVDLRVVNEPSFGSALQYFTGSKDHSIRLRTLAKQGGMKLNEYGLWRGKQRLAGKDEAGIYKALGLQFIPPELRENLSEIELARAGKLPKLIEPPQIKGDLHLIANTPAHAEALVQEAAKRGWHYIGIGPHLSSSSKSKVDCAALFKAIKSAAKACPQLHVYTTVEVDVLKDGRLDLPVEAQDADIIIGSVQNGFRLSRKDQTSRLVRALNHPALGILSHPTGRRAAKRAPYDVDLKAIAKSAVRCGVALELSADPDRLDLSAPACRIVSGEGAMISISSEAQSIDELDRLWFGLDQARRGWLEPGQVLNAMSSREIDRFLSHHRAVSTALEAS